MKKNVFPIVLCIIVGFFMGIIMFNQYDKSEPVKVSGEVKKANESVYFFQYGVYKNKDNMLNNLTNINYTYEFLDDKYYVYLGMTRNEGNLDKIKGYFENLKYDIYIKQIEVNGEFADTLKQYDLLLNEAETSESITTILKSIISKYEELAIDDENKRNTN